MRRMLTIAAMFVLALPSLAAAEEPHPHGKPGGVKPGAARPAVVPHGPMGAPHPGGGPGPHPGGMAGPHPGGPLSYHGHAINRVHLAPFVFPPGYAYRHWGVGMALPALSDDRQPCLSSMRLTVSPGVPFSTRNMVIDWLGGPERSVFAATQ